jgi:Holliday junction resolvase
MEMFNNLPESKVQKQVVELLEKTGWLIIRVNGGGVKTKGRFVWFYKIMNSGKSKGYPDITAFKGSNFLLVECKKNEGGKLSQEQLDFIDLSKSKNVLVHVVKNISQLINILGENSK